uniref:Progestin and adipoQ receptor family member 5 n=1 Tax=Sphenodon punctatus TaxID=8508 RepID=A0A8D0HBD1_SPHPU
MLSWKLPRLLTINQVPRVFREQGILFGYRPPKCSAADCILSVFQLTNETVNIWTHFLPTWYFLWKLLALFYALDFWNDMYVWPFLAYMVTCCIYPLASSCAHTFSTMSTRARHVCYFFDYGALSLYSLGKSLQAFFLHLNIYFLLTYHTIVTNRLGFPYLHYNNDILERFPEVERPKFSKALRTLAFAYPYLYDSIPVFYRLHLHTGKSCTEEVIPIHYRHTVFAFLTCFIFATHLPERLAPGRFDYIGHSHQLFHVCGIIGTHFQMEAIIMDMTERHDRLLVSLPALSFSQTAGSLMICMVLSLSIIGVFSVTLYSMPKFSKREKNT